MKLKMIGSRVLVKPIYEETMLDGILLPETTEKKPTKYEVIDVGGDVIEVQVGDFVVFGEYAGIEVSKDKEVYRILEEEEIMAIVS